MVISQHVLEPGPHPSKSGNVNLAV